MVIGRIVFWICPVCQAIIPNPDPDRIETDFLVEHRAYHLGQAQDIDELAGVVQMLLDTISAITGGYAKAPTPKTGDGGQGDGEITSEVAGS